MFLVKNEMQFISGHATVCQDQLCRGRQMAVQILALGKKRFVVIPEKEYRRLQKKAGEISVERNGDIAEAKRREREPSVSLTAVRKRLGI
jgi:hypothetical protein